MIGSLQVFYVFKKDKIQAQKDFFPSQYNFIHSRKQEKIKLAGVRGYIDSTNNKLTNFSFCKKIVSISLFVQPSFSSLFFYTIFFFICRYIHTWFILLVSVTITLKWSPSRFLDILSLGLSFMLLTFEYLCMCICPFSL